MSSLQDSIENELPTRHFRAGLSHIAPLGLSNVTKALLTLHKRPIEPSVIHLNHHRLLILTENFPQGVGDLADGGVVLNRKDNVGHEVRARAGRLFNPS